MITAMATLASDRAAPETGGPVPAGPRYEILPFGKGPEQAAQIETPLHLTVTTSPKHGVDRSVDVALRLRKSGQDIVASGTKVVLRVQLLAFGGAAVLRHQ